MRAPPVSLAFSAALLAIAVGATVYVGLSRQETEAIARLNTDVVSTIWSAPVGGGKARVLLRDPGHQDAFPVVRRDGSLLFVRATSPTEAALFSFRAGERPRRVRSHPAFAPPPARSADGRTIAYARGAEIVVRRAGRERPYRVGGVPTGVAVSPGGDRILFESARRLLLLDVSSGSSRVVVARGSGPAWSPDGHTIAYSDDRGLVFLDLRTNARTPGPARAAYVSFAPDGRSVVYARVNAAQSIPK